MGKVPDTDKQGENGSGKLAQAADQSTSREETRLSPDISGAVPYGWNETLEDARKLSGETNKLEPAQKLSSEASDTTELADRRKKLDGAVEKTPIDLKACANVADLAGRRKKLDGAVDKTKLDVEACADVASRALADQVVHVQGQIEPQESESVKQFKPIDGYRKASSCKSRWEDMKGTEQVRFCEKCKLQVYNFSKMELPEAEAFIFQREGRRNVTLYKRADGNFLTSDCPSGAARHRSITLSIIAGVLLVVGVTAILKTLPPAHRPAPVPTVVKQLIHQTRTDHRTVSATVVKSRHLPGGMIYVSDPTPATELSSKQSQLSREDQKPPAGGSKNSPVGAGQRVQSQSTIGEQSSIVSPAMQQSYRPPASPPPVQEPYKAPSQPPSDDFQPAETSAPANAQPSVVMYYVPSK